ncbi:MAG TPA: ATP-binding cassette domain-containing protein [Solirubrobacterales bacterium]|nr:ATP-binding cassette domain-containing protein [Solirubrobacterales bacterium]
MPALRISELTIEYFQGGYSVRPVDAMTTEASDGELVLLLGPSGSGKTTLLSCLAGLLTPTSGRVAVGETEVTALEGNALAEYRRHGVGVIFQAFNLIPSLTARENVAAPMRLAGARRREANTRAEALLTRVGLKERMSHRPGELSGGEQQRVAIARALVHDAPLIVADEPTAHLDYVQVESVLELIRALAVSGRLVIVATHDERLTPLADRVIDLTPERTLAVGRREVRLAAGEQLFEMGDPADRVYVVDLGRIELFRPLGAGGEEFHAEREPGTYFGELGPLLGLPRSTSARALEDTVLTGFGPQEFRHWRAEKNDGA